MYIKNLCEMPKIKHAKHCITLDGVGPVDNRPSVDKLHHFVQRKEEEKCGMQHTDVYNPGSFLLFWGC